MLIVTQDGRTAVNAAHMESVTIVTHEGSSTVIHASGHNDRWYRLGAYEDAARGAHVYETLVDAMAGTSGVTIYYMPEDGRDE